MDFLINEFDSYFFFSLAFLVNDVLYISPTFYQVLIAYYLLAIRGFSGIFAIRVSAPAPH